MNAINQTIVVPYKLPIAQVMSPLRKRVTEDGAGMMLNACVVVLEASMAQCLKYYSPAIESVRYRAGSPDGL